MNHIKETSAHWWIESLFFSWPTGAAATGWRVTFGDPEAPRTAGAGELIDLNDALEKLQKLDAQKAELAKLRARFFTDTCINGEKLPAVQVELYSPPPRQPQSREFSQDLS